MLRRLSCATLLAAPLAAQSPQPLGDLQVTATRVATEIARTAAAVTVLQGDDLRAQGITTLLEALRLVPGAAWVQSGSYGAVASLFLRGGENDFVKVLLDGVPLNLPGGQLNAANIALDDVERIEVVRGPVSVQHGADAMSGVIQVFTRRGQGRVAGDLAAGAGTWGNADLRGSVRGAAGGWHGAL
jgi:vitamin B12 transporter